MQNEMKQNREFLKEKCLEIKGTLEAVAEEINVNPSTFRTWVDRNILPKDKWRPLAKVLGISAHDLKAAGLRVTRTRRARSSFPGKNKDILPLVRVVAKADLTSLTIGQLKVLVRLQTTLKRDVTPTLVSELIKAM